MPKGNNSSGKKEGDMSQFRYKRNIKYLDRW